jgi:hypothetical protein
MAVDVVLVRDHELAGGKVAGDHAPGVVAGRVEGLLVASVDAGGSDERERHIAQLTAA